MDNYELENAINSLEEQEAHISKLRSQSSGRSRVRVGIVEQYFDKIGVAAIKLTDRLSVGDVIEIGGEDEAIRQRVESMQVNREDVTGAGEGESVGVKTRHPVAEGSEVYRIG